MQELKKTPLHSIYSKYGGKTIDFGGWDLPVQFSSILEEHQAVRTAAGLFDVSHMGEFEVKGPDALLNIQRLITNDASRIAIGGAQYSPMCNESGGTVDDLLVYRLGEEHFWLVVNAGNIDKDYEWVTSHRFGDVELRNLSADIAQLALQGPKAAEILSSMLSDQELILRIERLPYYNFLQDVNVAGISCLVSRTGYTGEDGFELYCKAEEAANLFEKLVVAGKPQGLLPIGLGARDTLRFEARLPLYGQELSDTITPLEAGLGMFVKLDKAEFIGKEALALQKASGVQRKLVGLSMLERGIARTHYEVQRDGRVIGEVTTGTFSPTLKMNIALALIEVESAVIGTKVHVMIRNKPVLAEVIKTPFYKRGS